MGRAVADFSSSESVSPVDPVGSSLFWGSASDQLGSGGGLDDKDEDLDE